ncbi:MAG: hypothetical protein ABWY52_04075 [Candidatus Limnocylindrales bacterium]
MGKLRGLGVSALLLMLAGCSLAARDPQPSLTTCTEWLSLPDRSQTDLAAAIVESNDLLESVRLSQHREPGTSRASLIQDVVGSVTKNCEVMAEPDLLIVDLIMLLYGGDRVYETLRPDAPTPETEALQGDR